MLKNDIYNIDREFDYDTVRSIVLESLEKLVKEEALKRKSRPRVLMYLIMGLLIIILAM
jgi:hypothetical protein